MSTLFLLNDPPYGAERSYNALRLARTLLERKSGDVRVFLIGDAVACAHRGQKVPHGYYDIGDMLGAVVRRGGDVGVCGTCMDARGVTTELLIEGAARSTIAQLADWTGAADKVLVF